jgi:hypothetical protein
MAKKSQTQEFVVRLDVPVAATMREVQAYVLQAVVSQRAHCHYDDPMYDLDSSTVRVTRPRPKKSYLCSFTGHFIGGNAIIKAQSPDKAAKLLEEELKRIGLPQEVDAEDMELVDDNARVLIVSNGDY